MDTVALHDVTEDFAAFLSEVTPGDLGLHTPDERGDVGDLYLRVVTAHSALAAALAPTSATTTGPAASSDRGSLGASFNLHGGGLEVAYRRSAALMERAFALADPTRRCRLNRFSDEVDVAAAYELAIHHTVSHTRSLALALALPYTPAPDIAQRLGSSVLKVELLVTHATDIASPVSQPRSVVEHGTRAVAGEPHRDERQHGTDADEDADRRIVVGASHQGGGDQRSRPTDQCGTNLIAQ